ncbi:MAG: hypothetical protein ABIP63_07030 [Thermoanaerobaculia bacterium]
MPKFLFYLGAGFSLFLALSSAAGLLAQLDGSPLTFVAVHGGIVPASAASGWAILVALLAGLAASAILVRMSALLAARNLFGAFLSLVCTTAALLSLAWTLVLQAQMVIQARRGLPWTTLAPLHFAALLMLGCFVALTFLTLRPYFRIQASRVLSALVLFPFPLFCLILMQELFVASSAGAVPATSPASQVFFAIVAVLFFAIAVHCIRHRHLFIETTNLRELLDSRGDRNAPIGGVAFDS